MGFKSLRRLMCGLGFLMLCFAATSQATTITLDAGGVPVEGILRTGSSDIGILFLPGRGGSNNGNFVKQVGQAMNAQGYTTLSITNPEPSTGTSWLSYVAEEDSIDDQLLAHLDAALAEMANQGVKHVVFSGLSMGSRLITAGAAAWQSGVFNPSADLDLIGLIGAGMYPDTGGIAPTPSNPSSIDDFNVYDVASNLALIDSIPVLDIYGSLDSKAVNFADGRRAAYGGDAGQYVQTAIDCPAIDGSYYAFLGGGVYSPYLENRCHQLRDGYGYDAVTNSYYLDFAVRAPMISAIGAFMNDYVVPQTQVPEPPALLLILAGLPLLALGRRRRA